MGEEEVAFLKQLTKSLEQAEANLENAYKRGDTATFVQNKKFILNIQQKISEVADDI